jgi:phage tail sheath gpL-like
MARDVLTDGNIGICFDASLNFLATRGSIIVEGQYVVNGALANPIVPDKPLEIPSVRYVDSMFTAGSILAEALKLIFKRSTNGLKVFVIPRQDNGAGVATVYKTTITGPATSAGQIDLWLGDKQYSPEYVAVASGATVATIANAIVAKVPTNFPYTPAVVVDGITWTAKNKGTVGNYLAPVVNWKNKWNYGPAGVTLTTTRTTAGSANPSAINYLTALGTCCYDAYALLMDDATVQTALRDWLRSAWDCTKPQCFGHGYTWKTGTLGQILAMFDNSPEMSYLAAPVNDVNFPWAMTAVYAAASVAKTLDNPELSIQGREHGLLNPILRPSSCDLPWESDEIAQLKENGFVTFAPLTQGSGVLTTPYIINDVTNYLYDEENRPNTTYRDVNSRRLATVTAIEAATKFQEIMGLGLYTRNTRIPEGVFGTNVRLITADMHNWALGQVGRLFSEFDNLQRQLVVKEDFEVAAKCAGVPCKLHVFMQYRPPCRISSVSAKLQPKMIDNCDRGVAA